MSCAPSYESLWEDTADEEDLAFTAADIAYKTPGYESRRYLQWLPYDEYLKSNHWFTTRKRALLRAGSQCQLCEKRTQLNVHHLTYVRRGREKESDLIVLCWPCHEWAHADPDRLLVLRWHDLPQCRHFKRHDQIAYWAAVLRSQGVTDERDPA